MPALSPRRRRRIGRVVVSVLGAALIVVAACAVWIGVRGAQARTHLETAESLARGLADSFGSDPLSVATTMPRIVDETSAARSLTSDPIWKAGERMPWVGPQLHAVGTLAAAIASLSEDGLQPLGRAIGDTSLDALTPSADGVDLAAVDALAAPARDAADAALAARSSLDTIDDAALLAPLAAPVDRARTLLGDVATASDALARAAALIPPMLGRDGPRSYLVIVQNNAEWRSLGGIAGAAVLIRAEGGRLSFAQTDTGGKLSTGREAILPLTADQLAIFTDRPARYFQNVTQLPDFADGARLAQAFWQRSHGDTVDGVLSLDPVALSYLLEATGPATLATGDELRADNAASLLLNEVYLRYENPEVQDAFFAAAAGEVFRALTSGAASPGALVEALARAGDEHRVLIWNARAEEQAVLQGTTLQGGLPVSDATTTPIGVYANDATGSKMDYYMRLGEGAQSCGDGRAAIRVTLRNTAPADAAGLPRYITGGGAFGYPPGEVGTITYLYLPPGVTFEGATADAAGDYTMLRDGEHTVVAWSTRLPPGGASQLSLSIVGTSDRAVSFIPTPSVYTDETPIVGDFCTDTAD